MSVTERRDEISKGRNCYISGVNRFNEGQTLKESSSGVCVVTPCDTPVFLCPVFLCPGTPFAELPIMGSTIVTCRR